MFVCFLFYWARRQDGRHDCEDGKTARTGDSYHDRFLPFSFTKRGCFAPEFGNVYHVSSRSKSYAVRVCGVDAPFRNPISGAANLSCVVVGSASFLVGRDVKMRRDAIGDRNASVLEGGGCITLPWCRVFVQFQLYRDFFGFGASEMDLVRFREEWESQVFSNSLYYGPGYVLLLPSFVRYRPTRRAHAFHVNTLQWPSNFYCRIARPFVLFDRHVISYGYGFPVSHRVYLLLVP